MTNGEPQAPQATRPTRVPPATTPAADVDPRIALLTTQLKKARYRPDALIDLLHVAQDIYGSNRLLAAWSALPGLNGDDEHGHGSHVISAATHGRQAPGYCTSGREPILGAAPGADIVSVRAFDAQGNGTYLDVLTGRKSAARDGKGRTVANINLHGTPLLGRVPHQRPTRDLLVRGCRNQGAEEWQFAISAVRVLRMPLHP